MSDQFKSRLTDHFKKLDEARAASAERARAAEADTQDFQTVSTTPPPNAPEAQDGYIGLHCSNDIKHNSIVARDPMFRVAFFPERGKVHFFASSLIVKGAPEKNIKSTM